MKFKELEFVPEEIIKALEDAGISISEDDELTDGPTLKEPMDSIEATIRMFDELQAIVTELDAREISNNCVIQELQGISYKDLCDRGIEILTKLKGGI